jgi:hypothetical protein
MFDTPVIVIGLTGAAFLIGSLAPVALESRERASGPAISVKGDRLPLSAAGSVRPSTVSTIEVVGLSQATVVFKDRDGQVLYRADPLANTTAVAKNVDLPVVTLREEQTAPAVPVVQQQPEPKQEGGDPPAVQPRRGKPVGCEASVSALARSDASRVPGLCLAGLARPRKPA